MAQEKPSGRKRDFFQVSDLRVSIKKLAGRGGPARNMTRTYLKGHDLTRPVRFLDFQT